MPLISFRRLIVEARSPSTMLNNTGESGHPCCVPDLKEKALSSSPLRMMFAVGLSDKAFTMLKCVLSIHTF